jgi:hypothetical protein
MILKFSRHFRQAARRCTFHRASAGAGRSPGWSAAILGVTWEWSGTWFRGRDLGVPR